MNRVGSKRERERESKGEKNEVRQDQSHHGPQWERYVRETGVHSVGRACKETKTKNKQEEVVWGQRWLPVCLWNTSQLALTVNAGKTTFPKRWWWWWWGRGGLALAKEVGSLLRWHGCGAA